MPGASRWEATFISVTTTRNIMCLTWKKTIFQEISDAFPDLTGTRIRNVLAAFLFTGDDVFQQIKTLSGGERGPCLARKTDAVQCEFPDSG